MPFGLHPAYLIILLAIVLIIFGPGKLPELGGAIGRGMREFRKASSEMTDEVRSAVHERESAPSTTTTTTVADDKTAPEPKS
jgi:TatA/E family protein of Tat protein translocase